MARYIDLEELVKRINDNIKPETPEEKALIEWCKDECIRQAYAMPRADVAPRSEVERWRRNLEAVLEERAEEKAEVAREIFEEIARKVYSKIPDKILPVTFGEMSRHLDYSDGLNFGSRNAYFDTLKIIAELKKKYTEGKK